MGLCLCRGGAMNPVVPDGFVCDECLYRHPFMCDIGKTVLVTPNKHEEGQNCTGLLCRRCLYGDLNREQRRASPESVCLSPHEAALGEP